MKNPILEIHGLYKTYAHQDGTALKNISFKIFENEKVGIVGANGSGKTTLFRCILNIILIDKGKISILGKQQEENFKKYIGFVPENQEGLDNFTPNELLTLAGQMSGMSENQTNKRKIELLKWVNLRQNSNELISGFSKGMAQRFQLAVALIHEPKILILDEPMSGLDPEGQNILRTLLKNLENYTLLYSSHNLTDVEELCGRVIFFQQGKIVKDVCIDDSMEDIFTLTANREFEKILDQHSEVTVRFKNLSEPTSQFEFITNQKTFQLLIEKCKEKNINIAKIRSRSILEDFYNKYVTS
jgi:ABC-2 type transport system ATP-binding protein